MKVINSTTLAKGTTLLINAQGLKNSLRGKKDGFTYFGCKKKSKPLNKEKSEILNDFIIRNKDPETNDRHRGCHFQIEYCIESNSYRIKDLGIGFGAFVKIDQPLVLKDNNLLSMGSSFLIINFSEDMKESLVYSNSQEMAENNQNSTNGNFAASTTNNLSDKPLYKRNLMNSPVLNKKFLKGSEISSENPALMANISGTGEYTTKPASITPDITIKIFGGPNYGDV